MIKINKNISKFYEKDFDRMLNILIYNILRNDNKSIIIVVAEEEHKKILQKKIKSKKVLLGSNVKFISEDDVYKIKEKKGDLYILMYCHSFQNKKRIIEIIEDNYIEIGKASIHDQYDNDEHSILIKNKQIDIYRCKWENKKIIDNREIIEWIVDTLRIAEKRAYLECPWYNSNAFDTFKQEIIKAVNRGIDVVLRFGINCDNDSRFSKTQELIDDLILEIGLFANFKVIRTNTHIKQALIDNWYLHSSMNFGSNTMNYTDCPDENATINFVYRENEISGIVRRFKEDEQ